jgi:hypothetical protein
VPECLMNMEKKKLKMIAKIAGITEQEVDDILL